MVLILLSEYVSTTKLTLFSTQGTRLRTKSGIFGQTIQTDMEEIRYRMATPADAGFVAEVVAEALGNPIMERIIDGQETAGDRLQYFTCFLQ